MTITEDAWIELAGRIRQQFHGDTSTCDPIGNVNQAIPYLTKPSEFSGLSGDEIRTLVDQTRHLRTHQPLGEFREFCRELERTGTKLARKGGQIVRIARSDGSLQTGEANKGDAGSGRGEKRASPPADQVVRIGPPRPHGTPRSEPYLYVRGYQGDLSELLNEYPDLRHLRDTLIMAS